MSVLRASQLALVLKNLPANAGDMRDMGSIPGSGRSPEGGHNNPLQNSCLENSTNRGATVRRVAENQTHLKHLAGRPSMSVWKREPCLQGRPPALWFPHGTNPAGNWRRC